MISNKIGGYIGIIAGIFGVLVAAYVSLGIFNGGEDIRVHLGVKEQSKIYLLTTSSTSAFKRSNSEDPTLGKETVIEMGGDIYVKPGNLRKIVNLISKNHTLFNREKKRYDGFVTISGINNNFSKNKIKEEGEKIGQYIYKNTIELKNDKGNILHIRWINRQPEDDIAEENCEVIPLVIADNYKPGATSYYTVDIVAVKLGTILDFYDNGTTYEYDTDNEILYFIQ